MVYNRFGGIDMNYIKHLVVLVALFCVPCDIYAVKHGTKSTRPEVVLVTSAKCLATGVLLDQKTVLTAAHAVQGADALEVTATCSQDKVVRVQSVKIHPNYRPDRRETDLALLVLEEAIDIGVAFPVFDSGKGILKLGTKVYFVGRTQNGKAQESLFFSTNIVIVSTGDDANVYGGSPSVVEPGDSGGPVYTCTSPPRLVGIVNGRYTAEAIDVYSPLDARNQKWIRAVMCQDNPPSQTRIQTKDQKP